MFSWIWREGRGFGLAWDENRGMGRAKIRFCCMSAIVDEFIFWRGRGGKVASELACLLSCFLAGIDRDVMSCDGWHYEGGRLGDFIVRFDVMEAGWMDG